jgi:hypothetical protein
VVQSFAAGFCRFNRDRQVFFDLGLSDEFREALRPQLQFKLRIILDRRRRHDSLLQLGNVFGGSH